MRQIDKNLIIGIDPGKTGSISIIDLKNHKVIFLDIPLSLNSYGKSKTIDVKALKEKLEPFIEDIRNVYLEKVHSMPKQGVVSTFNFGVSLGLVVGLIESFGLNIIGVEPRWWKSQIMAIGKGKDYPRVLLIKERPELELVLKTKGKGQARADAFYIAMCGSKSR